ncbi:MAG: hybrid sensor histidine kinase/response regulator [Scytolyngbya sp. HA4215-MV1]|jgi:signal transduction histidine kinase|nr:hybrid sensor histidine kinase/response regulator [Scytolyngbya sp. HA4215-MV1]
MNLQSKNRFQADILIVDDTPDNIRFLSVMLLERGFNVRKALTGQMALTAVQTLLPDLILLDVNMPGMDGYEVCRKLKENPQTQPVPIIFLSALDDVEDKVKAFQMGGVDYITKPFQFEEVLARVQTQLNIFELRKRLEIQNAELKQSFSELKKIQAQLIQQEKMMSLGQLVAGVAHEINNPISFIAGNLKPANEYIQSLMHLIHLYQTEYPKPSSAIQSAIEDIDLDFLMVDLPKIMGSMQTGVERICTVILALRIFSRLDESEIKLADLHEGIDSALLLLQPRLRRTEENFEIQIIKQYGDLPLVNCYAGELNQVFFNLLNNAIDALECKSSQNLLFQETPKIWIGTELIESKMVVIRIKDNGIGIAKEFQSRLFDPFFTTKPVGKGVGLGLSTSYQIVVERHKGQLFFQASAQEGAEFIIQLPIYTNPKSRISNDLHQQSVG